MRATKTNQEGTKPLDLANAARFLCMFDECAMETSYPSHALRTSPDGNPVCEPCYYAGQDECWGDEAPRWEDLRPFDPFIAIEARINETEKLRSALAESSDRVEGLSSELDMALDVLWRRGDDAARHWIQINFPKVGYKFAKRISP